MEVESHYLPFLANMDKNHFFLPDPQHGPRFDPAFRKGKTAPIRTQMQPF